MTVPAGAQLGTGLMLAVAGAVAFSGKAIIVKLAYRYGVEAVTLLMYRMLFALPLFVAMACAVTFASARIGGMWANWFPSGRSIALKVASHWSKVCASEQFIILSLVNSFTR